MKITVAFDGEQREIFEQLLEDIKRLPVDPDPLAQLLVQTFTFEVSAAVIEEGETS